MGNRWAALLSRSWIGSPLPCTPAIFADHTQGFAVFYQAVEYGGHRGQRILVANQDGGKTLLNLLADFAHRQRPSRFPPNHATRFGEAGLAPSGLAVD